MAVLDRGVEALALALIEQGYRQVDHFDLFITFARDDEPMKIQVGPDGAFAVFDGSDELITEGEGQEDLYGMLVERSVPKSASRARQPAWSRKR